MRVLLVEDQIFLAEMVAEGLRRDAVPVDVAHDGVEALRRLELRDYDVLILDRDLPGLHGDEVCRRVVAQSLPTRVLMLTASGSVRDRVDGLGLGADDYLTKPFAYAELLARVLALGRRSGPALPPAIRRGALLLDSSRRSVTRHGRALALSRKEFGVLETLLRADGAVVSNEDLIETVWEENTSYRTNAVRITISKLRAKLGDPPLIETVTGAGYRVLADADADADADGPGVP
ncbi:DNA-binding response regulator, OmpR family, contains REC and winged-helix (wHTH) domain [Streptomyces zhaozhouensis]|uniref:DNA-binding response regulator, OmpR family, contains REC and winged-helix (WHTH) domain n=1 Tax=Streptomyces zhaozhouensis TaxID=1300267 RepID=A0A286DZ09_9ACTN|nr:response regulator transcription factor [Streptomyces zhaozhouensis]SOD63814.1 DNA-binding response regulator, OmpR family, contains REC and winged-helix (wHTH) domain [Streptomyces zhaozhouensis]